MERKRKNKVEQEVPPMIEQEEERVEAVPQLSPQEIEEHDRVDREYFDTMPPGYRFVPTGEELITSYLNKKVSDMSSLPVNRIRDVNIYDYHPQKLTSVYKLHRGKEWYFFTPRTKKYPNGQRPDRAAGNGYWKATGADVAICNDQGIKIGTKKTLDYHEGKAKENNGIKTDWTMHEYRNLVDNTNNIGPVNKKDAKDMKLDDWVLCKIYNKSYKEEEAIDSQQDGNNNMIVPANGDQLPPNQNPTQDTFPRQNVLQEPNPTTNPGRDGASFYNRTSMFVPNQNITQGLDGRSFYNRVRMPTQYVPNPNVTQGLVGTHFYLPTQNVQMLNPNITHGLTGGGFHNMVGTQNVQGPNRNITPGRDGTRFCNMASNLPTQNMQVPNPRITHGDGMRSYSRASLPVHNVQVLNSTTNQFPYGVGFDHRFSLPIQNDDLAAANFFYNSVSFPPSDYEQTQTRCGRKRPYIQTLGNNHVNSQQVISPNPIQIVQAPYQHQIIPPHQDMGMDNEVTDFLGDEPYDTSSQEGLQGEEQIVSLNYPPNYPAHVDCKDEVPFDSKDGEFGGPDQAGSSSKEKKGE